MSRDYRVIDEIATELLDAHLELGSQHAGLFATEGPFPSTEWTITTGVKNLIPIPKTLMRTFMFTDKNERQEFDAMYGDKGKANREVLADLFYSETGAVYGIGSHEGQRWLKFEITKPPHIQIATTADIGSMMLVAARIDEQGFSGANPFTFEMAQLAQEICMSGREFAGI